jgi:hypothetical protein
MRKGEIAAWTSARLEDPEPETEPATESETEPGTGPGMEPEREAPDGTPRDSLVDRGSGGLRPCAACSRTSPATTTG